MLNCENTYTLDCEDWLLVASNEDNIHNESNVYGDLNNCECMENLVHAIWKQRFRHQKKKGRAHAFEQSGKNNELHEEASNP
mgnify:CR=1 FL=1